MECCLTMAVSGRKGKGVPKQQPTADGVYEWATQNDVPAPDAFAMRYWDLDGKPVRLKLAAASWRQRVRTRRTGFPAIDQD
jgi:hypothetical protein